ncbi:MAG TPA: DUF5694 domain-containing protein [Thermoanaerobaculia bacterium]|nr:DUF5694 domain-containing protein [Thermoanaerobaculia bacterium]
MMRKRGLSIRSLGVAATWVGLALATGAANAVAGRPQPPRLPVPVLLLGTFHFQDAGLDDFRPQHDVDVLSEGRQAEVAEVVACLAAFRPTRVAVEAMPERAAELNERLSRFRAGEWELPVNEVYQLGFRVAARLGHEAVYPVDAKGRWYEPYVDPEEYSAAIGQEAELAASEAPWLAFYDDLYAHHDEMKTRQSLLEHLLAINAEDEVLLGHGRYLVGSFKAGRGEDYPGVDAKIGWWARNLRIFANLQRLVRAPDERLLLIIGAGHLPILRHAVEASPELDLVEVREVLRQGCGASDRAPGRERRRPNLGPLARVRERLPIH